MGCTSYVVVRRCTTLYVVRWIQPAWTTSVVQVSELPDVEVEEVVGTDRTARIEVDQFSELDLGRWERCVRRLLVE